MDYDLVIFQAINGLAGRWPLLDGLGIFFATYLAWVIVAILVGILFSKEDVAKHKEMALVMVFSVFASLLLKEVMVVFFARPRPYMALYSVHQLIPIGVIDNLRSFPSSHSLIFFSVAMVVCFYHKKLGIVLFVASLLIGVSRIFVGVHWPSDILGGAFFGICIAFLVHYLHTKYQEIPKGIVS